MKANGKPLTKTQFIGATVDWLVQNRSVGAHWNKQLVEDVLKAVTAVAKDELYSAGKCTVPELYVQLKMVDKPATPARPGRNPATGEEIMIPARPARNVLRVTPMKKLKDSLIS